MGYNVHITRKESWHGNDPENNISLEEWIELVKGDADMQLDNVAEATLSDGTIMRTEAEGTCIWKKYSLDGEDGNHAWFSWFDGNITVKNPDQEIIDKMVQIAIMLGANVQGDEMELYSPMGDFLPAPKKTILDPPSQKKQWWKFW